MSRPSSRKPLDKDLYEAVKEEAKRKFDVWPSAYASGWVVKTYKARGGRYAGGDKKTSTGLTKWFGESWVDLSRPIHDEDGDLTGYEPCGRKTAQGASNDPAAYPKCRPLKEAMRMSPSEVKDAIKRKRAAEAKAAAQGGGRGGGRGGRGARAPVRVSTARANPDVTSTPTFRRWFGDSKVVDAAGKPLVVYHGTDTGGFYEFDTYSSKVKGRRGVFFTSDFSMARSYVRGSPEKADPTPPLYTSWEDFLSNHEEHLAVEEDGGRYSVWDDGYRVLDFDPAEDDEEQALDTLNRVTTKKKGVYAVYLRIENPMEIDAKGANWDEIPIKGVTYSTNELALLALDAERDGLIIRDVSDSGSNSYSGSGDVFVVFNANQIKSSKRNVGTFDPDDDDIRRNSSSRRRNPTRPTRPTRHADDADLRSNPDAAAMRLGPTAGSLGLKKIHNDLYRSPDERFSIQRVLYPDDGSEWWFWRDEVENEGGDDRYRRKWQAVEALEDYMKTRGQKNPALPDVFRTKFAFSDDYTPPPITETRLVLREARRGDVVTVGRSQWVVMRVLGDIQLLAYKHPSKHTKLYEIRLEGADDVIVFEVGGSGQRISEDVASGPLRSTGETALP